jgi:hypothetical protein
MSNKNVFSYDFEKIDNNLLSHISILYLNDVIAFISLTKVIAYNGIIEETIQFANTLPKQFYSMLFALKSTPAILNNLFTAGLIEESKIVIKDDVLPQLVLQPLLTNLICNYKIIPYINKTKYFHYLQQKSYPFPDIEKIINIIYESCNQFATDGEIKL